jgi:hypothetical protein
MNQPMLKALLVARQAYQDDVTGEWNVTGTFNMVGVSKFPALFKRLEVFAAAVDVSERCTAECRIVDPELNTVDLCSVPVDPAAEVNIRFRFLMVEWKRAGRHGVEFMVGGHLVGTTHIQVEAANSGRP